jgi:hypothetical protein
MRCAICVVTTVFEPHQVRFLLIRILEKSAGMHNGSVENKQTSLQGRSFSYQRIHCAVVRKVQR